MGFFNAFKNIVMGKPVFTPDHEEQKEQYNAQPHDGSAPVGVPQQQRPAGPKVLPPTYIERIEYRQSGDDMQIEAIIQNYSHEEVLLDKVEFFGKTVYLNGAHLSPGEEEEIELYEGDRPKNTNSKQCMLYYKNEAGDYFATMHNIEYEAQQPDGTYAVRYIRFLPPVRDV